MSAYSSKVNSLIINALSTSQEDDNTTLLCFGSSIHFAVHSACPIISLVNVQKCNQESGVVLIFSWGC